MPSALEAWSLNHWTPREAPLSLFMNLTCSPSKKKLQAHYVIFLQVFLESVVKTISF